MTLRLLSYNIRVGGAGREAALTEAIRAASPDVVVLQEANRPEVVERVAAATGMTQRASDRSHSVGYMSRIEVAHHAWHRPSGSSRAFLELVLAGSGVRVFGVHLSAAHANWMEGRRVREIHALLGSIAEHARDFHVLAGDFNTLAPGERLDPRRLPLRLKLLVLFGGRTIRWRTVQVMLDAGYVDGYRSLHPDTPGYTFPEWDPHIRLDYVFVPASAAGRLRRCEVIPARSGASDHLPLLAELEA